MHKKQSIILILLLVVIVGCSFEPETNPKKYSALMASWNPTGLNAHFPNPIPATATNVKLSACPGFLQGGAWLQLRLSLTATEVSAIYDDAVKRAKDFYDGGSVYKNVSAKPGGLPGTSFYTSDNGQQIEFPTDYRIFTFAARPYRSNNWNHGQSHGMVISKQRNEVIYYAEQW